MNWKNKLGLCHCEREERGFPWCLLYSSHKEEGEGKIERQVETVSL